ncbi:MAG: hypothetical protein RSH78_01210, partial [Bacilli bacterium]
AISSPKLGLMVGLGVGIHNIPLGIVIASTYQKANNNQKKTIIISLIILSPFITLFIFGKFKLNIFSSNISISSKMESVFSSFILF